MPNQLGASCLFFVEPISDAGPGLDLGSTSSKLHPQSTDVSIDRTRAPVVCTVPDIQEYVFSGKNVIVVRDEISEKIQFSSRKVNAFAVDDDTDSNEIGD